MKGENSDEKRARVRAERRERGEPSNGKQEGSVPELFPSGQEPGQPQQDPMDETSVSPEEQAQYTQVIKQAGNALYNDPKAVIAAINHTDQPIHEQVGRLVAQIGIAIEQKARAAGDEISPDVLFHAGDEVVGMVLDLAIQAKIIQLDPESDEYQKVHGLCMMEAEKVIGDRLLKDPQKAELAKDEAGNEWARRIGEEVDSGQADPEFVKMAEQEQLRRNPVAEGVGRALHGDEGG